MMVTGKKAGGNSLLTNSLRTRVFTIRFFSFILLFMSVCCDYTLPLWRFSTDAAVSVSWCVFPFLMTNNVFLCLFWLGIVYIHSDIPFSHRYGMYQVIRVGRLKWALLNLIGIWFRSFLASISCAILSIIPLISRIEWGNTWGKLFYTLALTDASGFYGVNFTIDQSALSKYTPVKLMGSTVLIVSLIGALLGTLLYVVAVWFNRFLGIVVVSSYVLMMFFPLNVDRTLRPKITKLVPAIWARVSQSATPNIGIYWMPSFRYMLTFLFIMIALCTGLILLRTLCMDLEWISEDL